MKEAQHKLLEKNEFPYLFKTEVKFATSQSIYNDTRLVRQKT